MIDAVARLSDDVVLVQLRAGGAQRAVLQRLGDGRREGAGVGARTSHHVERRLHRLGQTEHRRAARRGEVTASRPLERHDVRAQLLQCRRAIGSGSAVPGGMQRGGQRVDEQRAHAPAIAEAHLDLGRMHVDVDLLRRQRHEQRQQGMATARDEIAVGGAHGADQQLVLHRAAVDEQELLRDVGPVQGRQPGKARDRHAVAFAGYRHRVVHERAAHDAPEALQQAVGANRLTREAQALCARPSSG